MTRQDDAFLRKIIWWIGGLALISSGAIGVMQVQISANSKAVEEIRETNKTLHKINITLQKVLSSGEFRNRLLVSLKRNQSTIAAEQQRRTTTVRDAAKHMKDRGIHQ